MPVSGNHHHHLDEALTAVRVAMRRPRYRRRLLKGMEVPGGDGVLRSLRAIDLLSGGGGPSIKAVAAQLGIEASTASRLIDGAERSGLLTKRPCVDDLRRSELALTARGGDVLTRSSSQRRGLLAEATAGWERDEVDSLAKLLSRLAHGLEALADEL